MIEIEKALRNAPKFSSMKTVRIVSVKRKASVTERRPKMSTQKYKPCAGEGSMQWLYGQGMGSQLCRALFTATSLCSPS